MLRTHQIDRHATCFLGDVQSSIVLPDDVSGRAFISALESIPVVLMSEGSTTVDVMRAVQLGAADFLDKPLSVLKLKNIWQHSVRRMMQRTSICNTSGYVGPSFSEPGPQLGHQLHSTISGCLPSSMTGPICPQIEAPGSPGLHKSPSIVDTASQDHEKALRKGLKTSSSHDHLQQSSIDSPGTPSGTQVLPSAAVEAAVTQQLSNDTDGTGQSDKNKSVDAVSSGDSITYSSRNGSVDADLSSRAMTGDIDGKHGTVCDRDDAKGSSTYAEINAIEQHAVAESKHFASDHTAAGSHLPRFVSSTPSMNLSSSMELPGSFTGSFANFSAGNQAPLLIKSRGSSLDSSLATLHERNTIAKENTLASHRQFAPMAPAASVPPPLPEGFLKINVGEFQSFGAQKNASEASQGPIGLKLRKSQSFLDLINSTLQSSTQN